MTSAVLAAFVFIVFSLSVIINSISLYVLYQRRDKQPLKSRSPLWLGISLVMSELQVAEYLWVMVNLGECHVSKVIQFFSYTGYLLCLIIRSWKLHFAFHVNKNKILKDDYKNWFHRNKKFVSDYFLLWLFMVICSLLCFLGIIFQATNSETRREAFFGQCENRWIPDSAVNAFFFVSAIVALIVFSFILHNINDGFKISVELRLSITITVVCWALSLCLMMVFDQELVANWIIITGSFTSVTMSVYYPIYLSFTHLWQETEVAFIPDVSIQELEDINHFLSTVSGFEPFLRFLHSEFSAELIFLWKDIEEYSKEPETQERREKGKTIMGDYFDTEGNKYMQDSIHFKATIETGLLDLDPSPMVFNGLKNDIEKKLRCRFSRFKQSQYYTKYVCSITIKESLMEMGLN